MTTPQPTAFVASQIAPWRPMLIATDAVDKG